MSRLTPADFENVLTLIASVYQTPNVPGVARLGCGGPGICTGYTVDDIIASVFQNYPDSALAAAGADAIEDLLVRGSKSGVFVKSCSTATTLDIYCDATADPVYRVNGNMAKFNMANQVYLNVLNAPLPPNYAPLCVDYPIDANIPSLSYNTSTSNSNYC